MHTKATLSMRIADNLTSIGNQEEQKKTNILSALASIRNDLKQASQVNISRQEAHTSPNKKSTFANTFVRKVQEEESKEKKDLEKLNL
mmetsp:Transcript_19810/g.14566  ORF Transcript_19810/g.14566 Transcript_19810/m.14566 type:complete len:88 (+) Transcript_19810:757-1020(+)